MSSSTQLVDYESIIGSLPSLSKTQLAEVKKRATALASLSRSLEVEQSPVEDEDWLLHGVLSELRRRGLDHRPFNIRNPASFAGFSTQSASVRETLVLAAPDLTAVQRRVLGEIAAYELARYLQSWKKAPEINRETMLRYISRVPEAVETAYPGYLEAGLLSLIVR